MALKKSELYSSLWKSCDELRGGIVAHELAHLIERRHNDRFTGLLDRHLRQWRQYRELLSSLPLSHAKWED